MLLSFDTLGTGIVPLGGLIQDTNGNFYGTASVGGNTGKHNCGGTGCGLVFELNGNGVETDLFDFVNTQRPRHRDGKFPYGPLLRDPNGNLFGTVQGFGQGSNGAVFELRPDGNETVLYWFGGRGNAKFPNPGLTMDAQGNLYGTTSQGGGYQGGTVFEISGVGQATILYSFGNRKARQYGKRPQGGLLLDANGNLYGTNRGHRLEWHGV